MPDKTQDEALLKEVRDTYDRYMTAWREIREESRTDMAYLSGDPWTPEERVAREDSHRPTIALDELTQYVNQIVNDARMNKRGIKLTPIAEGATDQTAEARENLIRGIEYESNAQTAYTTAFEGAVQRGYGYLRVTTDYASSKTFNQTIRIKRIPNPDTVLMDPDCKEADCSDAEACFVTDILSIDTFQRRYPKAQKKSFDSSDRGMASKWVTENTVMIAEYWKVKVEKRTLLLLDQEGTTAYLDEMEGAKLEREGGKEFVSVNGKRTPILNSRKCEERSVCQYIVNGVEVLEENEWAGKYIPIIPCFGKEMFIDDGSGSKRVLMSLIRLARDPYKLYCYIRAQEMEEAAMTPRVPWEAYEGQLEGHESEWANAHQVPISVLLAKPTTDATGSQILPLPTKPQFVPNFVSYEPFCESLKRAIQSACGMYNSSVGKHDTNAKSGLAIRALESQSSQGNFHLIDNYDRCLQHTGRVINDLIPHIYDTARQVGMRKPDDTHRTVKVNDPSYKENEQAEPQNIDLVTGEHDVTVSTGPSFNSQREEASSFVDSLMSNLAVLPIPPELKTRLVALSIKLKQLGPIGDEMVETLSPQGDQQVPAQAQQQMAKMGQELQALNAYAQQKEAENKQLQAKIDAQTVQGDYKLELAKIDQATKLAVAEIGTKAQILTERMEMLMNALSDMHNASHELAMQKDAQAHQSNMADQQAQNASAQSAQDAAQTAAVQPQDQVSQ